MYIEYWEAWLTISRAFENFTSRLNKMCCDGEIKPRDQDCWGRSTGPWRNVGAVLGDAATTREELCCVGEYQLSAAGQSDGFQLKSWRNISKHCEIKQRVGWCENTCFRLMKRPEKTAFIIVNLSSSSPNILSSPYVINWQMVNEMGR